MTSTSPESAAAVRRRGPPPVIAVIVVLGLLAGVGVILMQSLGLSGPPAVRTPPPAGGAATATADQVVDLLGDASLQAAVAQRTYRPPETSALTAAPRQVLQVVLPNDPAHGYIVVYELPSEARAGEVGREYAAYLASGPGRVNFPLDTRFTIRRVASTLVFFHWSPQNWPDPRSPDIAAALDRLGEAIPVPS